MEARRESVVLILFSIPLIGITSPRTQTLEQVPITRVNFKTSLPYSNGKGEGKFVN
jgi:hypothetical protein